MINRVENLQEEFRNEKSETSALRSKIAVLKASIIADKAFVVGNSTQTR